MLNKVQLIGRLGGTPELRENDNTPSVFVSLATSEYWRDRQGNRQEHTEWHDLTFWSGHAENVARIAEQGDLLYVEGKLRTRSDEKDGVPRRWTSVVVTHWQLLKKAGTNTTESANADADAPLDESDDGEDAPEAA